MIPKLIGIAGPARAGKDTIGTYLKDYHGFKGVFFAEPLKEGVRVMFGLTDAQLYGDEKEKPVDWLGHTPRHVLQTLGTDWGREMIHNDVWLLVAQRKINDLMGEGYSVVVTDVRFENETKLIRDMGGSIWHVQREDRPQVEKHVSESGVNIDYYNDFTLLNNKDVAHLYDIVEACLGHS